MPQPTREELLNRAITKSIDGRNNAGVWLADQLRDNKYSDTDAESIMFQYQEAVENTKDHPYTASEAMASLKSSYRQSPRDPWTTENSNKSKINARQWHIQKEQRKLQGTPPRSAPEPTEKSIQTFRKNFHKCTNLAGSPGEEYLQSRGIPLDLAVKSGVTYNPRWPFSCGDKWQTSSAVVFSIRDENKPANIIAMQGRRISDGPGDNKITLGPKTMGVFATPGALNADPVAITEAPIDALSLALAGLPALALCGTSGLPEWLITWLATPRSLGKSRTVFLAFDADMAGDKASRNIDSMLTLVKTVRLRPAGVKDWNEMLTTQGIDSINGIIYQLTETAQKSQFEQDLTHICMDCGRAVYLQEVPNTNRLRYACVCGHSAQITKAQLKQ